MLARDAVARNQYAVRSTQYAVFSTRYSVLGTRYSVSASGTLALRCVALRILAAIGSRFAIGDLAERTLLRIHVGIFIHLVAAVADGVAPAAVEAL